VLEQSQGIGSEREAGSRVGSRRPTWLVLARVLAHGDDHSDGSCGVLEAFFHQGFPLLQRPRLERRVELDLIPWIHGDVVHCGACFGVGMLHAGGILP
jgi:hypothetical protein